MLFGVFINKCFDIEKPEARFINSDLFYFFMSGLRGGLASFISGLILFGGGCQSYSSVDKEVSMIMNYTSKAKKNPEDIAIYLDKTRRLLGFGLDVSIIEVYGVEKRGEPYNVVARGREADTVIMYTDEDGKRGYDTKKSITLSHELEMTVPRKNKVEIKKRKLII